VLAYKLTLDHSQHVGPSPNKQLWSFLIFYHDEHPVEALWASRPVEDLWASRTVEDLWASCTVEDLWASLLAEGLLASHNIKRSQ
jgi:hypothetical protein